MSIKANKNFANMKTITIEIKNVYGNEMIYPVCDTAKKLKELSATKTFSRSDLSIISSLGFGIEIKQPTIKF